MSRETRYIETWNAFPDLPGAHLSWRQTSAGKFQLVDSDGVTLARYRVPVFAFGGSITVGEQAFEERLTGKRFSRASRRDVVDRATGTSLFRIEGQHWESRADSVLISHDSHWYVFPVQGSRRYAVMTAVDESGVETLHFRRARVRDRDRRRGWETQVVVAPGRELTRELVCMIAVAKQFLTGYFGSRAGG